MKKKIKLNILFKIAMCLLMLSMSGGSAFAKGSYLKNRLTPYELPKISMDENKLITKQSIEKSLPLLTVKIVTSNGKFGSNADKIPFDIVIDVKDGDVLPANSSFSISLPKESINWETLKMESKPAYIKSEIDAELGVIKFTITNEISQAGSIGFSFNAVAKDIGNYTASANSSSWGEIPIENASYEIIKVTSESSFLKQYFETTGNILPMQATLLQNIPEGTQYTGVFRNDGNVVPIVALVDFRGFQGDSQRIHAGRTVWQAENEHPHEMNYESFYASFSSGVGRGQKISYDDIYIYNPTTGEIITDQFRLVKSPYDPDEAFFLTPKYDMKTKGTYFAIIIPIKLENPDSYFEWYGNLNYHAGTYERINTFRSEYAKVPNTTNFIPKLTVPKGPIHVPGGLDYDLLKVDGLDANDVEDGNLKEKIVVADDDEFDTLTPGAYTILYSVTDSDNNTVTKELEVIVDEAFEGAAVTVEYVDEKKNVLEKEETLTGKLGSPYKAIQKPIEGWKLKEIPANETGTFTEQKQTVTYVYERENATVLVKYVNEDGIEISRVKEYQVGDDGSYDEKEIDIDGFIFDHAEGKTSGVAEAGEIVIIIFNYKSEQFQLIQEVSHLDGSEADVVKNEAELLYTIKLTSQLKDKAVTYNDFKITEAIDPSLENIKDVKLVNSAGESVGKVEYANDLVTATITENDEIKGTDNLVLTYQATVKTEDVAPEGTEIKEQAIASGSYKGEIIIPAHEQTSNEVISVIEAGELIFESAPEILSFGDDNKISSKDEKIELVTKDQDLSVKDLRGKGNQWSMTVRLVKELTNGDSLLAESMYYLKDGKEQVINENTSAAVYEKTTDSADSIHISEEWSGKNKPILKVRAGTARIGNYQGTIQWSLQDVPNLE